jgi:two-component system response regulator RegA
MTDHLPLLLVVDDDATFRRVLARALQRRGYEVMTADSVETAIELANEQAPEYAVIDLKMQGASGLELVKYLHQLDAETRMVVLTGYASIATAVEAIKLGATHYLAKPANADEVVAAFARTEGDADLAVNEQPLSVDRLEWEHIQRVLQENEGNISATARALKMHRRTLQRKLAKYPVRE